MISHRFYTKTLSAPVCWAPGSRALVEVELNTFCHRRRLRPEKIHQAIRWSVFAGGKRFRPALLLPWVRRSARRSKT